MGSNIKWLCEVKQKRGCSYSLPPTLTRGEVGGGVGGGGRGVEQQQWRVDFSWKPKRLQVGIERTGF